LKYARLGICFVDARIYCNWFDTLADLVIQTLPSS